MKENIVSSVFESDRDRAIYEWIVFLNNVPQSSQDLEYLQYQKPFVRNLIFLIQDLFLFLREFECDGEREEIEMSNSIFGQLFEILSLWCPRRVNDAVEAAPFYCDLGFFYALLLLRDKREWSSSK